MLEDLLRRTSVGSSCLRCHWLIRRIPILIRHNTLIELIDSCQPRSPVLNALFSLLDIHFRILRHVQVKRQVQVIDLAIVPVDTCCRDPPLINLRFRRGWQRRPHRTLIPGSKVVDGEHDAVAITLVRHASVPEPQVTEADAPFLYFGLYWRFHFGLLLDILLFDPTALFGGLLVVFLVRVVSTGPYL